MHVEFKRNILGGWPELRFRWDKRQNEKLTLAMFLQTIGECFPDLPPENLELDIFSTEKEEGFRPKVGITVCERGIFDRWLEEHKK